MNLGVVVAGFNSEITFMGLDAAKKKAKKLGIEVKEIIEVFGAFDSPLAVKTLFSNPEIHAVIVIGAIVKGETKHDEAIAFTTFKTLQELSVQFNKPLGLAISGPGMNYEQAKERAKPTAENAVEAVKMFYLKKSEENKPKIM
jgi:6,7-dimethyl-8-ribityllumazine synthase